MSLSQAAQRLIRQCEEVKSQAQQTVLQKGWAPVGGDFLKPRVVDIQQAEASVARSLIEIEHRIRQVGPSDTQLATRLAAALTRLATRLAAALTRDSCSISCLALPLTCVPQQHCPRIALLTPAPLVAFSRGGAVRATAHHFCWPPVGSGSLWSRSN